jgi:hypothetical protein
MANEFKVAEQGHVVPFLYPISMNGIATEPEYVNMKNYSHIDIIIALGTTNGAAVTFTVKYSATASGGTAMPFAYYKGITASTDTLAARAAATTAGFAASNDSVTNSFYVISIDAAEIPDGYNFIGLVASGAATTTPGCAVGIMSGSRYAEPQSATVLS